MNVNQDYLTQITELKSANLALEKEIKTLKLAQATFKETENKFRTMVEQAAEGIVVTQELQKVYYNPAWLKLIGYSSEEYESLSLLSLIYPDDLELAKETYFHLTDELYEFRIIVKSGDIKWIAAQTSRIEWDGKPAELFIVEDITKRKQAEQALQVSEQNLLEAQAIAHVGHWEWDIPNDKIYWSDEVYRIFGLDPGTELNYDTLMATIHPDDRDYHNEMTAAWIKNRGGDPYEYRIIRPDGSIRYVNGAGRVECDKAGEPTRFIGTVQDITSLKLTEINLRESEARFRATFEQAAVGIAHVALDGGFLRVNQKFCEIVGYDLDEMLKLTFQDITHPDDLDADLAYVRKLLAGQIPTYSMEKRYFKKGGNITWINLTGSLVHTLTGDPDYFIAVVDEITERKVVQQALRESERKYRTLFTEMKSGCTLQEIVLNEQGIPVDYITLDINPAAEKLLSVRKKDVLGVPINSLSPPDEFHKWLTFFGQVALTGESAIYEQYFPFNDKYFEGNVYCPTQGQFAVIFDDVTERKQTDEELRLHSALINAVGEAVIATDMQGEIIFWNQAAERIYGWERDEVLGKDVIEVTPTEESSASAAEIVESLKQGNFWSGEFWVQHKDGHKFSAHVTDTILEDEYGNPKAIIGVSEDITSRKRIEQALNESELKYRTVVEQATEGIMVVQDYERKYYNSAFREMTGYSEEDYESNPFMTIIHPEDVSAIEKVYQALVSQQAEDAYSEFRIYTKSGDIKWLSIHGTSIEWEGRPAGMVIANDITERKHWEEQIQSYQRQLKALASQLTLTEEQERRRIAVELHDQVGQSLAFSRMQIAAAKSAKSDDQREALLDETSETLKETIQDTRSLVFDLSSPLLNELGLNAAISEWMEVHLEKQAGLKAELIEIGSEQHLSADMRAIVFRSARELLNNVIRHARATCVRVTVEQTSTQVRITVQDDGKGFRPEDIEPGLTRSSGYGIFSIQERMSDLGGSLTIQSTPGEGTQITLCIPNQVS